VEAKWHGTNLGELLVDDDLSFAMYFVANAED